MWRGTACYRWGLLLGKEKVARLPAQTSGPTYPSSGAPRQPHTTDWGRTGGQRATHLGTSTCNALQTRSSASRWHWSSKVRDRVGGRWIPLRGRCPPVPSNLAAIMFTVHGGAESLPEVRDGRRVRGQGALESHQCLRHGTWEPPKSYSPARNQPKKPSFHPNILMDGVMFPFTSKYYLPMSPFSSPNSVL